MREMAEANRDLERSKIEVQLKLFSEQMLFQQEKDHRLHESSRIANDNAKLAIEKQGEVVKCLAQLSHILSVGLSLPKGRTVEEQPHAATPIKTGHDPMAPQAHYVSREPPLDSNGASRDAAPTPTNSNVDV